MHFQHKRQQWPVGHGFFHTAATVVNGTTYRYIYDCGAGKRNTIEHQVDRYVQNEALEGLSDEMDMVVISHFHADHIKGIPHLFSKFNIKKLVLPYLSEDFKLVALAHLAASGPAVWRQLSGFVIDPRAWVRAQGQETEIIEVSDDEGAEFGVPPLPLNGNGVSLGKGRINHSSPGLIFSLGLPFWTFKFYIEKSPAFALTIIGGLVSKFGATEQDLKKWFRSPSWIRANWTAVAGVFKSLGSSKQNATTLCMYSGPEGLVDVYRYSSSLTPCVCRWDWNFYRLHGLGWLGTGDAELEPSGNFSLFENHFGDLLQRVDTVTIPHHGSKDNYNAKLGDFGFQHIITSDHLVDPKDHHPAAEVMLNLRTKSHHVHVVALADSTSAFERFDGIVKV